MTDIDKEHQVYMRGEWTDPEPDTLYVSVHSSRRNSEKFVVFSGNATWLNLEQAKEVREFLDGAIKFIERDSKRVKKRERTFEFKEGDVVHSQTVAGLKGRVFYVYADDDEVGVVWDGKSEDAGIERYKTDSVDFVSRPDRPVLKVGDKVALLNDSEVGVVDTYWDPEKYNTFAVKVLWDNGGGGYPNFWEITPVWYNFKVGDRVKATKFVAAERDIFEGDKGKVIRTIGGDPVGVKFDRYAQEIIVSRQVLVRERDE